MGIPEYASNFVSGNVLTPGRPLLAARLASYPTTVVTNYTDPLIPVYVVAVIRSPGTTFYQQATLLRYSNDFPYGHVVLDNPL